MVLAEVYGVDQGRAGLGLEIPPFLIGCARANRYSYEVRSA